MTIAVETARLRWPLWLWVLQLLCTTVLGALAGLMLAAGGSLHVLIVLVMGTAVCAVWSLVSLPQSPLRVAESGLPCGAGNGC